MSQVQAKIPAYFSEFANLITTSKYAKQTKAAASKNTIFREVIDFSTLTESKVLPEEAVFFDSNTLPVEEHTVLFI